MTHEEARQRIEKIAAEMCVGIQRDHGYVPDAYWLDRNKYRIQDRNGNPIATLHVETVQ